MRAAAKSGMRWAMAGGVMAIGMAVGPVARGDSLVEGYTEPSENLKLPFYSPGIVREVLVKEGDKVTTGQALIQQDDRIEKKALEGLKGEAFSGLNVKAAKADLQLKNVKLANIEKAYKDGRAATEFELQEAKAEEAIAEVRVDLAQQEMEQKRADYDRQQLKVELMKLVSPVNGRVQKIDVGLGEMAVPDSTKPAVEVVVNDPLWVKVTLPVDQAQKLKIGDKLDVSHDGGKTWEAAAVTFVPPFANGGSGTQTVRMDLANHGNRDAGLRVQVRLPEAIARAGDAAQTASSK